LYKWIWILYIYFHNLERNPPGKTFQFDKLTRKEKLQLKTWLINVNGEEDYNENIEKMFNADKKGVIEMTSNITKGLERLKEEGANEKAMEIAIKLLSK